MERALLYLLRARDPALSAADRREAFGRVVAEHQDAAFATAFAILRDAHAAQDAALEACVEAWRNLDSLREPAAFAGWLRTLVRTKALRHAQRPAAVALEAAANIADRRGSESSDRGLVVREALSRLPDRDRETVILFYIAGLTREETASFMGTSLVSAKKRLARALAQLRKETIEMENEVFGNELPSRTAQFREQVTLLCGEFAALLASGRPILAALDDCIGRAGDGAAAVAFREMRVQVTRGELMADVMRKHPDLFDPADVDAIQVGEEMGRLDDVLRRLAAGEKFAAEPLRREYEAGGTGRA